MTVVIFFLRVTRMFVGMWAGFGLIGVIGGCVALFDFHRDPTRLFALLVTTLLLAAYAAAFEGLRRAINAIHRKQHGVPHPSLRGYLSI